MKAKIKRIDNAEDGVFGVLLLDDQVCCVTLERPWLDNSINISCVPPGVYQCRRVHSPNYGDTFEISDVPGRTHILFHIGNTIKDSKGCVLLGSKYGELKDERAILSSGTAVKKFMEKLKGVISFDLEIIEV
jgi:hypothetical protein